MMTKIIPRRKKTNLGEIFILVIILVICSGHLSLMCLASVGGGVCVEGVCVLTGVCVCGREVSGCARWCVVWGVCGGVHVDVCCGVCRGVHVDVWCVVCVCALRACTRGRGQTRHDTMPPPASLSPLPPTTTPPTRNVMARLCSDAEAGHDET